MSTLRESTHMKMLAKSMNAKEAGDLTVIPLGHAVSIAEALITSELEEAFNLLKEADEHIEWFDYDEDGESYNNDEKIAISQKITKYLVDHVANRIGREKK